MVIESKCDRDAKFTNITFVDNTTTITSEDNVTLEHIFYNETTDRIETNRAVETTLNSLFLGEKHKMSSGGENIFFTNLSSNINWYPPWGGITDQTIEANRSHEGLIQPSGRVYKDFTPVPLGGAPVTGTSIPYYGNNSFPFNIQGVGITTQVAEVVSTDIILKYELAISGIPVYEQFLEHPTILDPADTNSRLLTWYFKHPIDITGTPANRGVNSVSIKKFDQNGLNLGYLLVCEGVTPAIPLDDLGEPIGTVEIPRYQTTVLSRFFDDKDICFADDLQILDIVGFHNIYVNPDYPNNDSSGTVLRPFKTISDAVNASSSNDNIFIKGDNIITSEITLPHSLKFYGIDGTKIRFASYLQTNGNIFKYEGSAGSQVTFVFNNIEFRFAGKYALKINICESVDIIDCIFLFNGWNGQGIDMVSAESLPTYGYDSSKSDLETNKNTNMSDGGAIELGNLNFVQIIGNSILYNFGAIKLLSCCRFGNGFITRNIITKNIESGIFFNKYNPIPNSSFGCFNFTVLMNYISFNANNGILLCTGMNNKFSQNEINGNWNAGFCSWSAGNITFRDSGLYDNNRSPFTGSGIDGISKGSIQINEGTDIITGNEYRLNQKSGRFIIEVLDTQIHYTGVGSSSSKIGIYIDQPVGDLPDNDKNIIKIDDVGFIGQDYAIDLSNVDLSNIRLSLGDNSYQSIGVMAVSSPLNNSKYSELPYSNHVMAVPILDVSVDVLNNIISLKEGVNGNTINVYSVNELESVLVGSYVNIIQTNSNKIQLRGLTHGNVYVNGVVAGSDINTMNNTLNEAFRMSLINYQSFLVSEIGLNPGNIFPTQVDSWKIAYGSRKDEVITDSSIVTSISDQQPFYNGNTLEKGNEFTWTHDNTGEYTIGIWSGAEEAVSRSGGNTLSNWSVSFLFRKNNGASGITDSVASEGIKALYIGGSVAIDLKSRHISGYYNINNNTKFALRYGMDNYLYLLDITNNTEIIIARSNSILIGNSQRIYFSGDNSPDAVFPVIQERSNIWSFVHDFNNSENDEWIDGVEEDSIIKSNMEINPGEMVKIYLTYFGRSERIGINYTGASSGVNNAQNNIISHFIYRTNESIEPITDWTPNTSSSNWDSVNNYWNHGNNAGVISLKYNTDNSLVLFSHEQNEIIATKTVPLDGTAFSVYIGFNESQPYERIPKIKKFLIENVDYDDNRTVWYYIESPDGNFQYPIFKREEEAKLVDTIETGSGTSSTITFIDDIVNGTIWYRPDTNFVNNGTVRPPRGAWGNSVDIIWNEQKTIDDSNYAPTFTDIVNTTQENTPVNIVFNTEGNTYTYEFNSGLPLGYTLNTTTPPTSIIGTTEQIEFSVPIQHIIDVTKSNSFGSVVGQIIINVLPNITSNEFTVISIPADNNLELTQDNGITQLSISSEENSPIFKAGETYKFYFDHSSIVSTDEFDFFLLSDMPTQIYTPSGASAYTTGVTTNGTFGDVGSYVQIELDDDVPPLALRWKSINGNVKIINLHIEESTFEDNQLAKTVIGPVSNINGTQVTDKIYVQLDVNLLPGQRIIIPKEFLKSATTFMESSSLDPEINTPLQIGIKNITTFSETDPCFDSSNCEISYLNNFVGKQVLSKFMRQHSVGIENNVVDGIIDISTENFANLEYGMFIEIPMSGDSVRMGIWSEPDSGYNINNTPFINWPGSNTNVYQTNITYNTVIPYFTGAPILFRFDIQDHLSSGFDLDSLDWDSIYKVGVPLSSSRNFRTTPWNEGVTFTSNNHRLELNNTNNLSHILSPTLTSTIEFVPLNPDDITKTSKPSNINSKPWACSTVFKPGTLLTNQHIWNEGSGSAADSTNIYLRIENKVLYFGWGKHKYPSTTISGITTFVNEYNECKIYTLTDLEMTEWWGIYIGFRGARFKATADTGVTSEQASAQNLSDAFDIRITSNSLGWDNSLLQCSTLANWTNGSSGFSMLNNPSPLLTIGSRNTDRTFLGGTIASMVITTLIGDSIMPIDSEIKLMITDPIKWTNKHKYAHAFRPNNSSNLADNIVWKDNSNTTQVWLMGDLVFYDSFHRGIKTYHSELNTTKLVFKNMLSSNLISVTIPGL